MVWCSMSSRSKRSIAWICPSVSLTVRLWTVCSSRSSRRWRVLRSPEDPHAPHPARTGLEPSEHQLVGHSLGPVGRVFERMDQDRLLDRGRDAVGVQFLRSRQPADQPLGAMDLEVVADLVAVLATVVRRSGTPWRGCRVPGPVVARTASGALSSLPGRWSFWFSSGLMSGLDTFSINLGEAGLATVLLRPTCQVNTVLQHTN